MPKQFSIQPLANLSDESFPAKAEITLPEGCTVECQQYSNHVYLLLHYSTNYKKVQSRTIIFVIEGDSIPDDYEYIGGVIANEASSAEINDEDDKDDEIIDVPADAETFYKLLTMINVYISPESKSAGAEKRWSFLGDSNAPRN